MHWSVKLLISLLICVGGGWLTGFATQSGVKEWYPTLIKSPLTPPDYVFPLAWTILYCMMAVALTLVWESPTQRKEWAFLLFGCQLFFNFVWSWLFFHLHLIDLAFLDIILLWIMVFATMIAFERHSKLAMLLLIPYLAWVSFAFYLNLYIWIYN